MVTPDLYSAAGISSTDRAIMDAKTLEIERTGRDIVASYLAGAYGPVGSADAKYKAIADIAKWYLGPAFNMDAKYVDTQASMSFDSWVFEATGGGQQQPTSTMQSSYNEPLLQTVAPPPPEIPPAPLDPTSGLTAEQQRLLDLAKAEEGLAGGAGTTSQSQYADPLSYTQTVAPPPTEPQPGFPDPAEYGPFTQYLRSRNLGATGGGPAGQYQRGQYEPLRDVYELADLFAASTNKPPGPFGQYLLGNRGGVRESYGRAGDVLRDLYAAGPEARNLASQRFGVTGFDPETGDTERDLSTATQRKFLRYALSPYFGVRGAAHLTGATNFDRLEKMHKEAQSLGGQVPGFLDYLKQKFNLGRYF